MRAAFVLVLTLIALAGVAGADELGAKPNAPTTLPGKATLASKAAKASVTLPKGWTVNATDELVRASSPDSQIAFVMWVIDSADTKAALTKLEGELYSSIKGLKWVDKTKKLKINRLAATWVEGVGVSGNAAQIDVLVVIAGPTATKKGVLMFAAVEHDKLVANRKAIQTIFQSLKPTK